MTRKEFTVRYKRTTLGFLWSIINPLLQMLIMGVVFSNFVNIPNYFVFLLSGLLPWQFFAQTLAKTTPCYINERTILQKAAFAKELIPLSIVLSNAIDFLMAVFLFTLFLLMFGPMTVVRPILLLPVCLWIILFTAGLSLLTSSLSVRFRDVSLAIQKFILLWFYATPVLYPISRIPHSLQQLVLFNPLVANIGLFQAIFAGQPIPGQAQIFAGLLVSIGIIVFGLFVFHKQSPYFVDWL